MNDSVYRKRAWLIENLNSVQTMMGYVQTFQQFMHGEKHLLISTRKEDGQVKVPK